jgi:glycosyltransferase involved in cell wall biosynthesis
MHSSDKSIEPAWPEASPRNAPCFLTIGMATCDDYDGCYFTIQAIRLYHPEILDDVELLIVDNNSSLPCAEALKDLENSVPNFRYIPHRSRQGTAVRDLVFRHAAGEWVLCVDSHVYFASGALARLVDYCRGRPDSIDLLQGPLLGDDLRPMATHFEPVWSHAMYGIWALDDRGEDAASAPFEIPMQGLGAFACRRAAWPGFNPRLAGFGGEEGYIHEKIRRAGGRNMCLPFLRWMHRFERPRGVSYPATYDDRIRNYLLIYDELGLDPQPVIDHFTEFIGEAETQRLVAAARRPSVT